LYEQMNFLFKFVKSRKSITNLTSKHPNESTGKLAARILKYITESNPIM